MSKDMFSHIVAHELIKVMRYVLNLMRSFVTSHNVMLATDGNSTDATKRCIFSQ